MPAGPAQQKCLAKIIQEHAALDDGDAPAAAHFAQVLHGDRIGAGRKLQRGRPLHQRVEAENNAFEYAGQHRVARRDLAELFLDFLVKVRQADRRTAMHSQRLALLAGQVGQQSTDARVCQRAFLVGPHAAPL